MSGAALLITDPHEAARRLESGGLVAIPTETVYGLAARVDRPDAVARVFALKGRPVDHPLIVHLATAEELPAWVVAIPDAAARLAAACWPGPLTLLLRRSALVPDVVTGGRDTVGIRVPAHPLTTRLLELVGTGLAAPSANRFGRVSPTTAQHVLDDLGDLLDPAHDAVLDGGACPVGVESTIVDCTVEPPQVLRPGGIAVEDVVALLADDGGVGLAPASGERRASGMLVSHYAPDATVRLVADRRGVQVVVAVEPPAAGLGHALRDRLLKAAAAAGR
ncbi:MAG: L-threonylcarbamoyladenylate synthase [Ilumatobacteraceae bacterium]|nr:L-threonylcarbamoyladenylate synthase [Ilumatobacteraceae bacterium]